jgi:hypothetical protein
MSFVVVGMSFVDLSFEVVVHMLWIFAVVDMGFEVVRIHAVVSFVDFERVATL